MNQRTTVVQQVKIHIHIKFYVNQSNFQRVMGLAKTCVKGQKSVFSNITLSKKIVTRVKKSSTFFFGVIYGYIDKQNSMLQKICRYLGCEIQDGRRGTAK